MPSVWFLFKQTHTQDEERWCDTALFRIQLAPDEYWCFLPDRHSQTAKWDESFYLPLNQGDPPELPEELVPCGLCVIHPCGLHLPDGGQSGLGGLQDSPSAADRPFYQNPEPAPAAPPVPTHPLHSPVGGGERWKKGIQVLWSRVMSNNTLSVVDCSLNNLFTDKLITNPSWVKTKVDCCHHKPIKNIYSSSCKYYFINLRSPCVKCEILWYSLKSSMGWTTNSTASCLLIFKEFQVNNFIMQYWW